MLQLLLELDQSYEDISGILGMEVGAVRRRARLALIEIGGVDPDEQVAMTDYLLGQADPITRADVARHLRSDPQAHALARKLSAQLRLIAPAAELPDIPPAGEPAPLPLPPAAPSPAASSAPAGTPSASGRPASERSSAPALTSAQRTVIAALLGAGVLILVVVLLVTGAIGGGDDSEGASGSARNDNPPERGAGTLTRAVLLPPGGGDTPNGVAIFGRLRDTPVIQVTASGLEPPPEGSNYSVWLYRNDRVALRLTQVDSVDRSGRVLIRFPIPPQALGFVADGTFGQIDVSLTDEEAYQAEVQAARSEQRLPVYTGTSVLRGQIVGPSVQTVTGEAGADGG